MCRQELVTEDDCGFEGYTANSWVDLYKLADVPAVVTCLLTAEERLVSVTAQFSFPQVSICVLDIAFQGSLRPRLQACPTICCWLTLAW